MTTISTEVAYRIRHIRGLFLSPNGNYEDQRVLRIAERHAAIDKELKELDKELTLLYNEDCERRKLDKPKGKPLEPF